MGRFTGLFRRGSLGTAGLGFVILALGCSSRAGPSGPNTISESAPGMSFTYLIWQEGLRILLVDNIHSGSHHGIGSGSANNPVYIQSGSAMSTDGHGYTWQIETTDGKSATFRINGKQYDLSQGAMFVLPRVGDKFDVHQMKNDLSTVPFDVGGCREYLKRDAEIVKLLGSGDAPK